MFANEIDFTRVQFVYLLVKLKCQTKEGQLRRVSSFPK